MSLFVLASLPHLPPTPHDWASIVEWASFALAFTMKVAVA